MARGHADDSQVALYVGLGLGGAAVAGALAQVTVRIGAASIPIWAIVVIGAALIFRGPLGKAIAERISNRAADAPELPPELYAELDELRARLGEIEERVDFSERLLTKQNSTSLEHS